MEIDVGSYNALDIRYLHFLAFEKIDTKVIQLNLLGLIEVFLLNNCLIS